MDKVSLIISTIVGFGFVLMIAPNVFAMNRGKVLQNIAAWLVIFGVLGLIYQNFGPGKNAAFTQQQASEQTTQQKSEDLPPSTQEKPDDKDRDNSNNDPEQGYVPPRD